MTPDLFLDEPWDGGDTLEPTVCDLAWLPLVALWCVIGGASAGVVLLADKYLQRRKP